MAEHKYDLALINTESGTKIREKPWYDFKTLRFHFFVVVGLLRQQFIKKLTVVVKI